MKITLRHRRLASGLALALVGVAAVAVASGGVLSSPAAAAEGPRLLFDDPAAVRAVAATGPGAAWAATVRKRADAALSRPVATTCQRVLRYDLPDLAMAWLLTADQRYAAKTREVLVGVSGAPQWSADNPDPSCQPHPPGDIGWRWPQLMAQTAYAYDWLRGSGVLSASDLDVIRSDLIAGGRTIYAALTAPENPGDGYRNVTNYRLRNDAGLGIVGLALRGLDDSGQAERWSDYAWNDLFGDTGRGTPRYFAQMVAADGVYKEGQGYYQDSFRMLIPYFVAAKRVGGHDAFADPIVHAAFEAPVATSLPDASVPTVDTGWRSPAYAGGLSHWVAAQYPDEPWLRWQWERENASVPANLRPLSPAGDQFLALALYRPGPSAPPPTPASRFLRANAYGVLRGDWSASSSWLLLNGEGVPDRSPHEQPDQTSFAFYAHGRYLAVDPGDGRNCKSGDRWTRSAPAHNLILVDGAGPAVTWDYTTVTDAARLDRGADVGDLAQSRVTATYRGVSTTRQAVLAHDDYAVIFDNLRSQTGEHDLTWQLHLAPGATDPVVTGNRAVSSIPGATPVELTTVVASGTPTTWSIGHGDTNYDPGSCVQHPIVRVDSHADRADLISVLYPRTGDDAAPMIDRRDTPSARVVTVDAAGRHDVAATSVGGEIAADGIRSDAARLFVSRDADACRSAMIDNAHTLVIDGSTVLAASAPLTATLAWRDGVLTARIHTDQPNHVTLVPSAGGRATVRDLPAGDHTVTATP